MISYTYVDNSNVFIEAQRVSAVAKGMAVDLYDAIDRRVFDFSYKLDYGKLYEYLCGVPRHHLIAFGEWLSAKDLR